MWFAIGLFGAAFSGLMGGIGIALGNAGVKWSDAVSAIGTVVAAIGTVGALFFGLYLARRDAAWRQQTRRDRSEFLLEALRPEFRRIHARLCDLLIAANATIRAAEKASERGTELLLPKYVSNSLHAARNDLEARVTLELRMELIDLEGRLGLSAIRVATELPRVIIWVEDVLAFSPRESGPDLYVGQFTAIAKQVAELGVEASRVLTAAGGGRAQAVLFERYLETGNIAKT